MVGKVLLIGGAWGLVESIRATSYIITESGTCEERRLGLRCHWEKVGRSLVLSVSIVCSRIRQGDCALILTNEARCHSLSHVIVWEGWALNLY
jgi:hypothetical protein